MQNNLHNPKENKKTKEDMGFVEELSENWNDKLKTLFLLFERDKDSKISCW
jgi:hypothetical protein